MREKKRGRLRRCKSGSAEAGKGSKASRRGRLGDRQGPVKNKEKKNKGSPHLKHSTLFSKRKSKKQNRDAGEDRVTESKKKTNQA